MTSTHLPTQRSGRVVDPGSSGRAWRIVAGVAALGVGVGVALIAGDLPTVFIIIGVLIVVVGSAFLWNEPEVLFPIAIYVMWFEALPPGPINSGRTVAFLALALPVARILTSSWRIPAIKARVWLPTALLLFWSVLSMLWSAEPGSWAIGMLALFLGASYAVLFALFVESPEQIMRLFRSFIVIGVIIGLLSALVHYGLGYRSFGFTGGPNQYALLNVVSVPVCVALIRRETGWWRWFFVAALPVFFIATLAAGSRSGLIGMGIITGFCFVFRPGLSVRQRITWGVIGFFTIVGGFLVAGILDSERFSLLGFFSDRGAGRLDIWTAGFYGIRDHWLLGFGIGGFQKQALALIQRATGASLEVARDENFRTTNAIPAHNLYLAALLDLGIVGFVLFFTTFGVAAKNLWDMLKTEWHEVAWIGLAVIVVFIGMGPFTSAINSKMPWAMVGISGAYFVRRASTDRSARRHGRLGTRAPDGTG